MSRRTPALTLLAALGLTPSLAMAIPFADAPDWSWTSNAENAYAGLYLAAAGGCRWGRVR